MDESPHERMEEYEQLAEQEREKRAAKRTELDAVSDALTSAVEDAIDDAGASVTVTETSNDGTQQTLRARLDRAALVATVSEKLPDSFGIRRLENDGSLTIEWDRQGDHSRKRRSQAILKAIVNEELETDSDDLIVSAPSRERVVERAAELGIPESRAEDRLDRLVDLDVVDIEAGQVYPGGNFSQF